MAARRTRRPKPEAPLEYPSEHPTPAPKMNLSAIERIRDILASATDPSNKLDRIAAIAASESK